MSECDDLQRRLVDEGPEVLTEGPDLAPVKKTVDQRRCWMFSGPGKNYHTDREQAEKLGFPNIVVQGMMSTCFVHQVMQDAFGMGWVRGGKMSVKLTNVLWVDERVTAHGRVREEVPEGTVDRLEELRSLQPRIEDDLVPIMTGLVQCTNLMSSPKAAAEA